ncbi:MAG: SpoIIE family protein phosphatase [Oscillospiraceae bacterium]|nr:SpoIIE family protein phosphatase [Oscillospiraceae bacterium]MCR5307270.1 SpoIIE family protein phosphatase [Oscillospiraceae bacterium]
MKHPDREMLRLPVLRTAGLLLCTGGACLLAAARFNGFLIPLNTALAAALPPTCSLALLAGTFFTYALTGMLGGAPVAVCSLALTVLVRWLLGSRCNPVRAAVLAGGSTLLSALIFSIGGIIGTGDWLVLLAGGLAAALLALCTGAVLRCCADGLPLRLRPADALPFAVCGTAALAAVCSLRLFMLHFGAMLAAFLVLSAARRYRTAGGVICGTLAACAMLLAGTEYAGFAAVLPTAGLAAGYLSGKGRGVLFVFMQAAAGIGLMLSARQASAAAVFLSFVLGGLLFLAVPAGDLADALFRFSDAEADFAALTGARMEFLSGSIAGVRGSAERIANMLARNDIPADPADTVSEAVCSKCRSRATCWENDGAETKRCFREMSAAELTAPLCPPEGCLKPERITEEFTRVKRKNAAARVLTARLRESQAMLFTQMRMTEELLHRIGQQTQRTGHRELTRLVAETLDRCRIPYEAASVSVPAKHRLLIELYLPADEQTDSGAVAACLQDALQKPLTVCGEETAGGERRIILQSAGGYTVSTAAAQCAVHEDEPCGDCWDTFTDGEGAVYLAVSDGMGSGRHAAVDARIVLSNFRALVQSGVNCEAAAAIVNAIMLTKSGEERFATLDVAKICTETAAVTLYKYGAGPTLIKHGERITLCQAATDPIGILPKAQPYTTVLRLERGDMLFLLSDGLDDSLYPYIRQRLAQGGDLQTLAHTVCAKAQRDAKGTPRDDVTVLAAALS